MVLEELRTDGLAILMIDLLYRKALRNEVSATMVVGRLPHRAAGQGHPHAPCNV